MEKRTLLRYALSAAIVVICSSVLIGQLPTPSSSVSTPTKKVDYSESVPYQPRVFQMGKDSKDKKKPKDDTTKVMPTLQANLGGEDRPFTFPVSVFTSDDKVVTGLSKTDLKVFIGDEEQTIISVANDRPLNVVLLLDVSPSTDSRIAEIRNIATQIVENLRPDDKVMVVQFCAEMKILSDFTTDRKAIARAISRSEMGDGTSLYNAIVELVRKKLASVDGPSSIILFSDGIDTTSRKTDYAKSLVEAEKDNAVVIPVYFDTFNEQLKPPKLPPGFLVFGAPHPPLTKEDRERGIMYINDLINLSGGRGIGFQFASPDRTSIPAKISTWLKGQYFVTINPSVTIKSDGRLPLRIRVERLNLIVLTKGSYFAGN